MMVGKKKKNIRCDHWHIFHTAMLLTLQTGWLNWFTYFSVGILYNIQNAFMTFQIERLENKALPPIIAGFKYHLATFVVEWMSVLFCMVERVPYTFRKVCALNLQWLYCRSHLRESCPSQRFNRSYSLDHFYSAYVNRGKHWQMPMEG